MSTIWQGGARLAAIGLACALAQGAQASCYHVYGSDGALIYRSIHAPVDMEPPFHESLEEIERGASLVFTLDAFDCMGGEVNALEDRQRLAKARAQREQQVRQMPPRAALRPAP